MKIFKYTIAFDDKYHELRIPEGNIIHFGFQKGDFCFWILHKDLNNICVRKFKLYATGGEIPHDEKYIGSSQYATNHIGLPFLVLHLFEKEQYETDNKKRG